MYNRHMPLFSILRCLQHSIDHGFVLYLNAKVWKIETYLVCACIRWSFRNQLLGCEFRISDLFRLDPS